MKTATNIPTPLSVTALQAFVKAAGEIESLLTAAAEARTRQDAAAIAAWVSNTQALLDRTGGWLGPESSELGALKATPEFQVYREHLHLLLPVVETLRQELIADSQNLLRRQQQIGRTRSWASTVGKLG